MLTMLTNVKNKSKEFPTIEFKVALLRHRVTIAQIAARLDVSRPLVSMVIHNRCTSENIDTFLKLIYRDMLSGRFTRLEDYSPRPAE